MSSTDDIKAYLDAGHSKELRNQIVSYVGKSKSKMKQLMHFFFHDEWRYNQRASWAVSHIALRHPSLLDPYLSQMVKDLDTPKHDAVKRNTLRIFEDVDIPENLSGELLDKCMDYLVDPKQAIAIRCFSITVIDKIVQGFPELAPEIIEIINDQLDYPQSAGFKVRAKRTLKSLYKVGSQQNDV